MATRKLKPQHLCRADTTAEIRKRLTQRFTRARLALFFELGLCRRGALRADLFAMSFKGEITIVEIKSSLNDFYSDKKYKGYLKYCHKMYIASTPEVLNVIAKDVPSEIGLIEVGLDTKVIRKTKKRAITKPVLEDLKNRLIFRNADNCNRKNASRKLNAHKE